MSDDTLTPHLRDWKRREELAEALIPIIGTLYRNHSLVVAVFGHSLVGNSAVEIITAHESAREIAGQPLRLEDTVTILTMLLQLGPGVRARGKEAMRVGCARPKATLPASPTSQLVSSPALRVPHPARAPFLEHRERSACRRSALVVSELPTAKRQPHLRHATRGTLRRASRHA